MAALRKESIHQSAPGLCQDTLEEVPPAAPAELPPNCEEIPKETGSMVALMFELCDVDKDGFLNQAEMGILTDKTNPEGDLSGVADEVWVMICQALGCDKEKGLKWTDLLMVYTKLATALSADLKRDFELLFPNSRLGQRGKW